MRSALPLLLLALLAASSAYATRIYPQPTKDWACRGVRGWTTIKIDDNGQTADLHLVDALAAVASVANKEGLGGACSVVKKPDRHAELLRACFKGAKKPTWIGATYFMNFSAIVPYDCGPGMAPFTLYLSAKVKVFYYGGKFANGFQIMDIKYLG